MSDADALLAAIAAAPDDDAPRLVYADWLDDHGDPDRAEFIRAQIKLEDLHAQDADRPRTLARAGELLARHADEWCRPYRAILGPDPVTFLEQEWSAWECGLVMNGGRGSLRFRRGFADEIILEAKVLFEVGASFLSPDGARPVINVRWPMYPDAPDGLDASADRLAGVPLLAAGHGIRLGSGWRGVTDDGLRRLAAGPHARRLDGIELSDSHVSDRGVLPLLASPREHPIRRLYLDDTDCSPALLASLGRMPSLGRVEHLMLHGLPWSARVMEAFLDSDNWRYVRALDSADCELDDQCVAALGRYKGLPSLRVLNVSANPISFDALRELLDSPHFPRLESLGAAGVPLCPSEYVELKRRAGNRVTVRILHRSSAKDWFEAETRRLESCGSQPIRASGGSR